MEDKALQELLQELLDCGALTKEEFEGEKKRILEAPAVPAGFASTKTIAGDRKTLQAGCTVLRGDKKGMLVSSWELRGPTVRDKIRMCCMCASWEGKRGYLYIRGNDSIELNDVNGGGRCCSLIRGHKTADMVQVLYFDRPPYTTDMVMKCPWHFIEEGIPCCYCYRVRSGRRLPRCIESGRTPPNPSRTPFSSRACLPLLPTLHTLFSSRVCCSPSRPSRL
jgi:hypothetical protein